MYTLTRIYPFERIGNIIYFRGPRSRNKVSLTFDDGPSESTMHILQVLQKYHMAATFFCIGKRAKDKPCILRRISKAGCELANHSYSHHNVMFKSSQAIAREIQTTDEVLRIAQSSIPLFRPRDGRIGYNLWKVCNIMRKRIVLWDIDSLDWSGISSRSIVSRVIRRLKPGSIIDLHEPVTDVQGKARIMETLTAILTHIERTGMESVTVSELLDFGKK